MRYLLTFSISLLLLSAYAPAQQAEKAAEERAPKIIGLLMYADWCQSCKVLEPKLDKVKKDFKDKGIFFTRLDMTDEFTIYQSSLYASWVGFEEIFKENEGRTGYMLLIDPNSRKVVGKLVKTQTPDEIRAAIQAALK
ncbi:MAG: thioredoxin domain-containing protein [Bacteroidota bacterium]